MCFRDETRQRPRNEPFFSFHYGWLSSNVLLKPCRIILQPSAKLWDVGATRFQSILPVQKIQFHKYIKYLAADGISIC